MKQALHIFAKDVRRFYPEILASLAILAAFVKIYPQTWGGPVVMFVYSWVPEPLLAFVVLSWMVLIVRAMHAESLIGDKQFWVTRPYRWGPLLSAKVLFAFTFVVLPFFAAQCLLLREGKFHPFALMPGVLFNTAMVIGIIVLPTMLLASITKSFPKMLLGLLFIAMYFTALGFATDLVPTNASVSDESWWLSFVLPVAVVAALLTCQYATRRTLVIRMLVVGAGLLLFATVLGTNDGDVDKLYAMHDGGAMTGVQVVMQPNDKDEVAVDPDNKREVNLPLRLGVSGIEGKTAIKADFARVTIDGPAGEHWESHWQAAVSTWLPGEPEDIVNVKISRKFYERMRTVPVTVKLSLALTKLEAVKEDRVIVPEGEFTTPGGSICAKDESSWRKVTCRSALRQPPLMLVVAQFSKTPCGSAARIPGETAPSISWIGTLDKDPAEFGITPVWDTMVFFHSNGSMADAGRFLCAGSALGFLTYTPVERGQVTMSVRATGLEHFAAKMAAM